MIEKIDIALTFDQSEKAQKNLEQARERLAEVQVMLSENDLEGAAEAEEAQRPIALVIATREAAKQSSGPGDRSTRLLRRFAPRNDVGFSEHISIASSRA